MLALRYPGRQIVKEGNVHFNAMYTRNMCPWGAEAGNSTTITGNLNALRPISGKSFLRPTATLKSTPEKSSAFEASNHSREVQPPPTSKLNQDMPGNQLPKTSLKHNRFTSGSHDTCPRPSAIPPKTTVWETTTSTAHGQKRKPEITVNTKLYRRLGCIGKGSSARVYRVTADDYRVMALKKVFLRNTDKSSIKGLKREIRLLEKLVNVDRVVHLFDWEINSDRKHLNLVRIDHNTKSARLMKFITQFS